MTPAPARKPSACVAEAGVLFDRIAAEVAACDAASSRRIVDHHAFAGTAAELRVAGDAAIEWTSAPFGAATGAHARDVTLRIAVASGAAVSPEVLAHDDAPGTIVSDARHVVHLQAWGAAGLDRAQGRVVALLANPDALPHWERAKPLATLLAVWCHDRGLRIVHAGMAARDGNGVLFVGPSGAGKSTASLACLAAGFDFLGDDCIGLHARDDGGFDGVRLYATATLERSHLERVVPAGELATRSCAARHGAEEAGKTIVAPGTRRPAQIASFAAVQAVILPRLTDAARTALQRVSGRDALLALAPSSIVRRAAPGAALLGDLARLVRAVPCYRLDMSRRPDEIPAFVERVLREVGAS